MLDWDNTFVKKCRSKGVELDMYEHYVDNETIICRTINRGWRYDTKKDIMVFSWETWRSDSDTDGESRTASVLAGIANRINKSIQVTTDFPSKHPNKRMPVLDLVLWTEIVNGIP